MEFVRALKRLWRHPLFRRLFAVRIATQASDGVLQVGMASYVLFSPQRQPDAWSIAAVLAITLLPFSVLGPFVSVVLDRWNRRQVLVWCDALRIGLALALAALVLVGAGGAGWAMGAFYGVVLVAMSVNRFLLAGLSAALPHTINSDEYLVANSVMPTVGPAGVVVGAGVATGVRLGLSGVLGASGADAAVFCISALGFALSVVLALRIPRHALGPDDAHAPKPSEVLTGLRDAFRHLAHRRPAALGLTALGLQRVAYGVVTVAVILVYRNYFHPVAEVDAAMADLGIWALATGIGFVLSAAVTAPMTALMGVRRWMLTLLGACAVVQVVPGTIFQNWTLVIASFLLGLGSQSLKICVDTLVQAHIDDVFKGRVFVIYDMVFNAALVLAAVIGALILPVNGVSVPIFLGVAAAFALIGVWFALVSGRIGSAVFNRGTEDLTAPEPVA